MVPWKRPLLVVDQWGPFKGKPSARKALIAERPDGGTLVAMLYGDGGGLPTFVPDDRGVMQAKQVHRRGGGSPYQLFVSYFPKGKGPNTLPDPDATPEPSRYPTLEEIASAVHHIVPRGCVMALSPTIAMGADATVEVPDGAVATMELRQAGQLGRVEPGVVTEAPNGPLAITLGGP